MNSDKVSFFRELDLDLPPGQSAFLWGARKTGKSTYLRQKFPNAIFYDLLQSDLFLRLAKEPHLFREEILALSPEQLAEPIIVDEVQKIPVLLDEIHWLIENTAAYFIMCGSSARKLRHGAANLLGGRAWRFVFYPLVFPEIPDFDLKRAINQGLLPQHYLSENPKRSLTAYVEDYLKEEIQAEGLVRNLPTFARFLDVVGLTQGEMINFTNIARDCGIDSKTVKEYYTILVDTLIGSFVYPYQKKVKRDIITATPKFYLFDTGVANRLVKREIESLTGEDSGRSFEQLIYNQIEAYRGLKEKEFAISYWRTKTGLELDFVLGNAEVGIEVKITNKVRQSEIKGLIAFAQEHKPRRNIVVSQDPRPRVLEIDESIKIEILPWEIFLQQLWNEELI